MSKPTLDEHFGDTPADQRTCECCGAYGVPLEVYHHTDAIRHPDEYKAICDLCAGSYLGVMQDYPSGYGGDTMHLGRLIAYVGNEILKELRKR